MIEDDETLIRALLTQGSSSAARQLINRHSPRLLAIVVRLLGGDHASAEDVLQQCWIKAIEALPTFRADAAFSTWITRIVIRGAFDQLRVRYHAGNVSDDKLIANIAAPPDQFEARIDVEILLARLPPGCRAVLVAHDLNGFTHEEIAETLHIAVGTSKAHLFRARRLLRDWLVHTNKKEA